MKDLAILVDNKNDSTEAQDLLFSMGYKWRGLGEISKSYFYPKMNKYFIFMNKNEMDLQMAGYFAGSSRSYTESRFKEITLPELRDLVVLKRNSIDDATHTDGHYSFYVGKDKNYFFSSCDKAWRGTWKNVEILKPIEKPMKEYLNKETYAYVKTHDLVSKDSNWIEIPEGAEIYLDPSCNVYGFYKDNFKQVWCETEWEDTVHNSANLQIWKNMPVLWQRHTRPEELPFIDDESSLGNSKIGRRAITVKIPVESLNDQYAEIETVRQTLNQRQEQYGSFEDVAMITEQMVDVMRKGYYENLAYNQKMALYMICSKMARIVNGNPNHKDSWHDIAGYATLIDNELESEKDMPF